MSLVGLCVVGALALMQLVVSEWQRRRTLLDVLEKAPPGSVVEHGAGMGGRECGYRSVQKEGPERWPGGLLRSGRS